MVFAYAISSKRLARATRRGPTRASEGQKPSQYPCLTKLPREKCPQLLVSKALSWGIIGKSACILADIMLRKSQSEFNESLARNSCIWVSSKHQCAPQQSGASHMCPLHALVNFLLVY